MHRKLGTLTICRAIFVGDLVTSWVVDTNFRFYHINLNLIILFCMQHKDFLQNSQRMIRMRVAHIPQETNWKNCSKEQLRRTHHLVARDRYVQQPNAASRWAVMECINEQFKHKVPSQEFAEAVRITHVTVNCMLTAYTMANFVWFIVNIKHTRLPEYASCILSLQQLLNVLLLEIPYYLESTIQYGRLTT